MSFLVDLVCSNCGLSYDSTELQTYCLDCQAPLLARYDLISAKRELKRDDFRRRSRGMWRWNELLPVYEAHNRIYLGEGDTPLLRLEKLGKLSGLRSLYLKDESTNPTGSFKARGLAAAVSKAKELHQTRLIIPTAGNAGGALAAYAARAGLEACIYMPDDTPIANIEESKITGASVMLINGLISEAAALVGKKARKEGWFDVSTFKEPYRTEGKKIMGYELAEEFDWVLPDVIIYPTGGGTGLVGMWKAFNELEALGWLENSTKPRLVSVQAEGCAPVVKAFKNGALNCEYWDGAHTIASGLRVPKSFADFMILNDLRENNGTAVSVSDESILEAQILLAETEGVFACPEGAATLAGMKNLVDDGWIDKDEKIVLFNTGTGLKYLH